MKTREYRLIYAKEKLKPDSVNNFDDQIKEIKEKIKPKDHQCIAMDGYVILDAPYDPDAVVVYKIPRKKVDYEINTFPKHLQDEIQKIQIELKLTKNQVKQIRKTLAAHDLNIMKLENQYETIRNQAHILKKVSDIENYITSFNRRYSAFNECLVSKLETLDVETKDEVQKKLHDLVEVINDVIKNYL